MELSEVLEEGMVLAKRLLLMMEEDKADMYKCIHGEVFDAYCQASKEAVSIVEKIQRDLVILQTGQTPGM